MFHASQLNIQKKTKQNNRLTYHKDVANPEQEINEQKSTQGNTS